MTMTSVNTPATGGGSAASLARRNSRMEGLFNISVFLLFAILWAAFAFALVWSQGSLDQVWTAIRGLPLILQGIVALLFLPVAAGLWVWETTWPLIIRLVLVAGLGFWNLYLFFPRAASGGRV
jgi:hypothetical protein